MPPDFTEDPKFNVEAEPATPGQAKDATKQQPNADMLQAITAWLQSVARSGEPAIAVQDVGDKFTIRATSDQHDRLARQIEFLRDRMHTQVTVETRFIYLGAKGEASLPATAAEKIEQVRVPGQSSAGALIDDATATAIIDAGKNDPEAGTMTAPRITLFNGQRAYVLVATQRSFTTGYKQKVDGTAEFEPIIEPVQTGLLLDVRCRADASRKNIAVNFKPEQTRLLDVREEPFKDAAADANLRVQVPTIEKRTLDAMVSMPNGTTMLFCVAPASTTPANSPRVYVLMRATVVER